MRQLLGPLLREPLVHFLIAGLAVFWAMSGRPADPADRRIVVDEPVVAALTERWTATYHAPPEADELDGLIRDYVRDQVYYREALRLGLDKDDEVVLRRMRNKMEALATSEAEAATPSDAQLQALIDHDPARYAGEAHYTFDQVYLGADTPANRALARAALTRGGTLAAPVPAAPLPARFADSGAAAIGETFGDGFAAALAKLPLGQWSGPVASGLGLHLIRLIAVRSPGPVRLAEVHQRAENDWRAAAAASAREAQYRRVRAGYDIVIARPR